MTRPNNRPGSLYERLNDHTLQRVSTILVDATLAKRRAEDQIREERAKLRFELVAVADDIDRVLSDPTYAPERAAGAAQRRVRALAAQLLALPCPITDQHSRTHCGNPRCPS